MSSLPTPVAFERAAAFLIVLLAAAVRLARLDLMEFRFDDGIACILGLQVLDGQWPLVGLQSSLHIYNPPLFVYLVAAGLAISKHPLFLAALIALANTAAVALTWRVGRRLGGPGVGLVAALLMAASPCAVAASRRIYAQDCVPLLAILIFWLCLRIIEDGRRRHVAGAIILTACLSQIHFSGLALAIALVVAALAIRPRLSPSAVLTGVGLSLLLYLPYVVHLFQTDFDDLRRIFLTVARGDDKMPFPRWKTWAYAFDLVGHADFDLILANARAPIVARLPGGVTVTRLMNLVALLGLLSFAPVAFRRRPPRNAEEVASRPRLATDVARLTLAWALVPPLVYSAMKLLVIPSYLFILFPVPHLMAAWVLVALTRPGPGRRARAAASVGLLALWLVCQAAFLGSAGAWLATAEKRDAPYATYRDQAAACDFVARRMIEGRTRVTQNLWSSETGIDYNYLYLIHWRRGAPKGRALFAPAGHRPDLWFRIVDYPYLRLFPAPEEAWAALAETPHRDFGALRVYFGGDAAALEAAGEGTQ